jgi:hypothetical protein
MWGRSISLQFWLQCLGQYQKETTDYSWGSVMRYTPMLRSRTHNVRRAVQYAPLSTPDSDHQEHIPISGQASHMHLNYNQNAYSEDSDPCNTNRLHCSVRTHSDPAATLSLPNYSTRPGGDRLNGTEGLRGTKRAEDIQTGRCVLSGSSLHSLSAL